MNFLTLVLMLAACACADPNSSEGSRQKRLLFFDEGGSLVKTYPNPYMNRLSENGQNLPFYGNFLNPFFNFIRHFGTSLVAYTIPVSNAILQAIKLDPTIQNTLVVIPKKDSVVAPNPLCAGLRTQIPSPSLCNNFLNCWDGWAFEQECPSGLLFSSYGYCDYADNVDCTNRKMEPELPQTLQPVCGKDFEAFRDKQNCNEFFVCVNRQPVRFQCPADLAYNQNLGVCDYADQVDCSSSGIAVPPSPNPFYPTPAPGPLLPSPEADTPVIPDLPSLPSTPAIPTSPTIPSTPAIPTAPTIPSTPAIPTSPTIPSTPAIPTSPAIPSSPAIPISPVIPAFPAIPSSPVIPESPFIPPSAPINPPLSPMIPPAPASIPQFPSLLPPGTVFPSLPSSIHPIQRPVPTPGVFPAPVPEGLTKPKDKLVLSDFFTPGCSPANVAMSRQDAVRLLQKTLATNVPY